MGVRLTRFQGYFEQVKPLAVSGHMGSELSSSFSMIVNDARQVSADRLILTSGTGELLLQEEEIYRVGPVNSDQTLLLIMDGGIELKFSPLVKSSQQPLL